MLEKYAFCNLNSAGTVEVLATATADQETNVTSMKANMKANFFFVSNAVSATCRACEEQHFSRKFRYPIYSVQWGL